MTDPTETARYRHRTPEVEAVQWTGSNADQLRAFCGPDFDEIELDDRTEDPDESAAVREGKHGTWRGLKPGDWVVKLDGGLYEFAAADFAEQYVPAVAAPATGRSDVGTEFIRQADHPDAAGLDAFEADLASKAGPKGGSKTATDQAALLEHRPCPFREPLLDVQCTKEAGHEVHSDRPGRIWYPVADDAVLPAAADRAAVYAEVADRLAADAEQGAKEGFTRIYRRSAAQQVREWAEELAGEARDSEQQDVEAHPPHDSWLVQVQLSDGEGWHVAYPTTDKPKALDRLERGRRETPDREWRLVRMTTSYAVEPTAEAQQDGAQP